METVVYLAQLVLDPRLRYSSDLEKKIDSEDLP